MKWPGFWLKGLQIATVGLVDGFRGGHANDAEKRSKKGTNQGLVLKGCFLAAGGGSAILCSQETLFCPCSGPPSL